VPAIVSSPKYKIKQNIALTDPSSLSSISKTPQDDDKESCVKKTLKIYWKPRLKKTGKKNPNSKIQLENPTRKSNSKIQLEIPTR